MSNVPIARHDELTSRVTLPDDSSDGIPVATDDASTETMEPPMSVPLPIGPQPTRKLADLTLGEIFTVLWLMCGAAALSGVDVEADPMPAVHPTGVHLWSADHAALCRWLRHEKSRRFASVAIERAFDDDDKLESARFLLVSLADGLPMAPVISVGPRRFIHWAFR